MVQPAENWAAKNLPGPFDGARERRILLQREMCAGAIVILHVRQQQVTEVALAEHDNVEGIPVGSNRSAVRHIRFAMGNAETSADRECPLIEVVG